MPETHFAKRLDGLLIARISGFDTHVQIYGQPFDVIKAEYDRVKYFPASMIDNRYDGECVAV